MENKMGGDVDKSKRKQHCTACKNHDIIVRKTSHKCPYENCECLLCQLTGTSRLIMRHQQRLWRHLKDKQHPGKSKKQVCDKCRNHRIFITKRNHKGSCPFEDCKCELCLLTNNRRNIMKHQQRVRRSATVTSVEQENAYEYVQKVQKDLKHKYGPTDCDDSGEERDDIPSSPEENISIVLDGTKKQFIERYRKDEDDRKPSLSFRMQHIQPQASSSNWPEAATSQQHVKEEIFPSETAHNPTRPTPQHGVSPLGPSPQHSSHIFNPTATDFIRIPNEIPNGIMCLPRHTQIGPSVASYPLNLLSRQTQPFMLNYTHPFNRSQHPMLRPPYHPHQ